MFGKKCWFWAIHFWRLALYKQRFTISSNIELSYNYDQLNSVSFAGEVRTDSVALSLLDIHLPFLTLIFGNSQSAVGLIILKAQHFLLFESKRFYLEVGFTITVRKCKPKLADAVMPVSDMLPTSCLKLIWLSIWNLVDTDIYRLPHAADSDGPPTQPTAIDLRQATRYPPLIAVIHGRCRAGDTIRGNCDVLMP